MARLRIGSRGSQLARWQAEHVAGLLRSAGHDCEIQIIRTTGDRTLDVPLAQVGSKGMFIKEIEEALAAGEIDLAVELIERLLSQPGPIDPQTPWSITLTELRFRWEWDPLRNNPRFQKILAGPEPKTVY